MQLFVHTGSNVLTNSVITMNKVDKLVQIFREIDKYKAIQVFFPLSLIQQVKTLRRKSMKLEPD